MNRFIISKIGITDPHSSLILHGKIVWDKDFDFERHAGDSFFESYVNVSVSHSCLINVSPFRFWSPANQFPDLVSRFHLPMGLMGNFGLRGGGLGKERTHTMVPESRW